MKWRMYCGLFLFLATCSLVITLIVGCETAYMTGYHDGSITHSRLSPGSEARWNAKRSAQKSAIDAQDRNNASLTSSWSAVTTPSRGPISIVQPGEELWVIAKPGQPAIQRNDDGPGSGSLVTRLNDDNINDNINRGNNDRNDNNQAREENFVPLPLKHTDVKARVDAYVATVDVTQQFHNPFNQKIEAVYVFPLPQNAAVNEFVMTIGKRKIRGIIRERAEAERIYNAAKHAGHNAALMTQERPNIFTQKVANIEPGKQIDINVKYFNTLAYADGWYEFVFPMVVGPRFNPPHTEVANGGAGDGVGAVGRGQHGLSGQNVEVQYLRPSERSGHDIALQVDVHAGVAIEQLLCSSHLIEHAPIDAGNDGNVSVRIKREDSIPNKDFVLRWRVTGDKIKSNMLVHRDNRGGFFSLMIYPPAHLKDLRRQPMEMIFVLDCSGSMSGHPMEQSKKAIRHALQQMNPNDTFQIIRFSNDASQLGARPLAATRANLNRGQQYLHGLGGQGGTMMIEGIKAALDFPQEQGRQRVVAFLTDGYIGNEKQILGEIHKRGRGARIFSFGIGSSVNRYLIERMALAGRGAVAYVGGNDDGGEVMDHFFERVSHPAMNDVNIEWGSMRVNNVFPKRVPDLFVGRPILMVGRFDGQPPAQITLRGTAGDQPLAINVPVQTASVATVSKNPLAPNAIPAVWARMQIADLSNQMTHTNDPHGELPNQIKRVALDYNLMSAYTAFVAVDGSRRTAGNEGTTVPVPVPVPEGVKYETTVKED